MDEKVSVSLFNYTTEVLAASIRGVLKNQEKITRNVILLCIGGGLMELTMYKASKRMARTEERLRRVQKELEDMKKSLRYAEEDA